jgi:hypothetical protein
MFVPRNYKKMRNFPNSQMVYSTFNLRYTFHKHVQHMPCFGLVRVTWHPNLLEETSPATPPPSLNLHGNGICLSSLNLGTSK